MSKISQYTALTTPAGNDLLPIVDVDNLAMAASGTTQNITVQALLGTAGVGLTLQATTGVAGFALQNGTPTIASWTAPNDGQLHRAMFFASLVISSGETGGAINVGFTAPDGTVVAWGIFAAGQAAGYGYTQSPIVPAVVKAGTTVTISQGSPLTAGAAKLYAEIWGS